MKPDISILLPFFDTDNTLTKSIESMLEQSYKKFELLLLDTQTMETNRSVVNAYASQDPRIRLLSTPIKSYVDALNEGINACRGKYIAHMGVDDISHPERLEKQRYFLEKNKEYDLVGCCVNYINDDDMQFRSFESIKWSNRIISYEDICLNRFIETPLIHSTVMYRKKLTGKYEMYRAGDFPEDYELWLRLLDNGIKMCKLPEALIDWKDSPTRLSLIHEKTSTYAFYEIKTLYLFNWLKINNPFHPKVIVWGAGRFARQRFSLLHDLGIEPKFFIDLRSNPEYKVIEYTRTPPAGHNFIVSYVSNPEARGKNREFLVGLGYSEGKDFICIA